MLREGTLVNMIMSPDTIVIIVHFSKYSSRIKRDVPNNTRRCLMGVGHATNFPARINEIMNKEVIIPRVFSLIKDPQKYQKAGGGQGIINIALGAITLYHYVGPTTELEETCKAISQLCERLRRQDYLDWSDFEVLVARRQKYG